MTTESDRKTLRMPITNVYARGGYSVTISLGSETDTAELILDTGSSSLVVTQAAYESGIDGELTSTSYVQCIRYGMGGWYGPVVKTGVDMICHDGKMLLDDAYVAIATESSPGSFAEADGILGLAFYELNDAFCLQKYLQEKSVVPEHTYPWPKSAIEEQSVKDFRRFLKGKPKEELKPYFTKLEEQGISADKFSFVTRRSSIHHAGPGLSLEELKRDPLNNGYFVLGGGEEDKDLYEGEFTRLKVIDDVYYNVRLLKVKVGDFKPFVVPKLSGKELAKHRSNAFVDTGASYILLDSTVFDYIMDCLEATKPEFKSILEPFRTFEYKEEGVPLDKIEMSEWPDIEFIFEGSENSQPEVTLLCHANEYWQVNAPTSGQACFKLASQIPNFHGRSILGLPLISGYYAVFSRFENEFGAMKFARLRN